MFTHALISNDPKAFMQKGYMIGTWAQCARYALANGLRTTTKIIDF